MSARACMHPPLASWTRRGAWRHPMGFPGSAWGRQGHVRVSRCAPLWGIPHLHGRPRAGRDEERQRAGQSGALAHSKRACGPHDVRAWRARPRGQGACMQILHAHAWCGTQMAGLVNQGKLLPDDMILGVRRSHGLCLTRKAGNWSRRLSTWSVGAVPDRSKPCPGSCRSCASGWSAR